MHRSLLFVTVLVIATCGLIYELVVGTLASYLLGDSITQFSTVIGLYLFSMGIGAFLSRFIDRGLAQRFVDVELAVAVIGGTCAPVLFLVFASGRAFHVTLYGMVGVIGTLVGLEIPLLLRLLKNQLRFKDLVSQVLTFDYLGALFASLMFPLLLVPKLGLVRTSLLFGLINAAVGLWSTWLLGPALPRPGFARARAIVVCALLAVGLGFGERWTQLFEEKVYADEVVHARSTPYQRIVVTQGKRGFSLFLNGNLQFASVDEYRYHEALVHPAMTRAPRVGRVLVLGGGDGLAVREILRYSEVSSITLVDIDPEMTRLARTYPALASLNGSALADPRVTVRAEDAMEFLAHAEERFDVAVVDFPDPNNFALGKLYTTRFYDLLRRRLADDGVAVIQSTSPLFARQSFWCVEATVRAARFWTLPYHALVPSFGEWGYVLLAREERPPQRPLPSGLRFLDDRTLESLEHFAPDMDRIPAEVNRLNNQVLVHYYEREWDRWN